MEAMLGQITPVQMVVAFAIQLWVVVIFPIMVFRKLNYLTELVESQFEEETPEAES
jgi:hypothetical protein